MSKTMIPCGYTSVLDLYQTQKAIETVKASFEGHLRAALNLIRVSAPLFVEAGSGINDDLNGVERPVEFDIAELRPERRTAQVVHSLAKWKRLALYRYGFQPGSGLYTDMNAIRRDEELDNLHSVYVDQWDWERVITAETRNVDTLTSTVQQIVDAICDTQVELKQKFPVLTGALSNQVSFVTTQELEDQYPDLTPKERENAYLKEHSTAFIMQIGDLLASGIRHDGRAPDYDDWKLNGDIVFWNDVLGCAFEVSSMGIRVDARAMEEQLAKAGCQARSSLPFHQMVLNGTLPLTMGGGIGQSRLCMLLLGKAHIGEVHSSLWDCDTLSACKAAGVELL